MIKVLCLSVVGSITFVLVLLMAVSPVPLFAHEWQIVADRQKGDSCAEKLQSSIGSDQDQKDESFRSSRMAAEALNKILGDFITVDLNPLDSTNFSEMKRNSRREKKYRALVSRHAPNDMNRIQLFDFLVDNGREGRDVDFLEFSPRGAREKYWIALTYMEPFPKQKSVSGWLEQFAQPYAVTDATRDRLISSLVKSLDQPTRKIILSTSWGLIEETVSPWIDEPTIENLKVRWHWIREYIARLEQRRENSK